MHNGEPCRKLALTKNQFTTVSAVDFPALSQDNWAAWWNPSTNSFYAVRRIKIGNSRSFTLGMHKVVCMTSHGYEPDHISTDTLDNSRLNLRAATRGQNMANSGKRRNNTSGYKGVSWNKQRNRWIAQIKVDGVGRYLGLFKDPAMAHAKYMQAAIELFGEFARAD